MMARGPEGLFDFLLGTYTTAITTITTIRFRLFLVHLHPALLLCTLLVCSTYSYGFCYPPFSNRNSMHALCVCCAPEYWYLTIGH